MDQRATNAPLAPPNSFCTSLYWEKHKEKQASVVQGALRRTMTGMFIIRRVGVSTPRSYISEGRIQFFLCPLIIIIFIDLFWTEGCTEVHSVELSLRSTDYYKTVRGSTPRRCLDPVVGFFCVPLPVFFFFCGFVGPKWRIESIGGAGCTLSNYPPDPTIDHY
jgi:hypothetical protein